MSFQRLGDPGAEIPAYLADGEVYDLRGVTADIDAAFLGGDGVTRARAAHAAGSLPLLAGAAALRVGPPIARPGKIVCIGLNYSDHAAETGATIPAEPVVFMKDPSTVVGPFDNVLVPRLSVKTDWEVELGVVLGSTARYLDSPAGADAVIAGYVLSHDVSEREFQIERGGQWDKGKSCETFNPLGPVFVPADEIADPQNLALKLWVNGELRQNGSTSNMVFGIRHVIWYLSQFMVLHPGDLVNTGTPAGVALGLPGNPYLRAGDVVELEIEGLGRARQEFVQA
ncbi:2-hydroxyhepta-2,4-diene-1,7-dioate isomerase [Subtercola boreus]|uniref:2-hydroxyhepta-2,4-diene-1,7-dioate isomerase n=1 Tax=Subtercola boreus TaxID=120213 RepID=A0A3E0VPN9_9MICO|nr:fumarylacetoacetate hydrolase family protein [Subtercola boreus]RFA10817.1 2-hydroxyhepta-2,4-diene-1,7-dioate isomerase [Subtercola boreus]TQL55606.1 2-keto-4-pentenoate hydratase/2-oxohepta-3-ene-1,7-dioic acid hydratase in catechol pathway [Subtercola boreus]